MGKKYKNKNLLCELYHKKGMTQAEIANELNCPVSTLSYWFQKFGIETRGNKAGPAHHTFDETTGYEKWRTSVNGERCTVMVHHLILVANGRDPVKVFSDDIDTHHKNGFPSDNRPENLKLKDKEDHGRMHANERWNN